MESTQSEVRIIARANGTTEPAPKPKNGTDYSLKELQEIVGGLIQIINLKDDLIMVVNEEGLLIGLEKNQFATALAIINEAAELIVGDVLVCHTDMVK